MRYGCTGGGAGHGCCLLTLSNPTTHIPQNQTVKVVGIIVDPGRTPQAMIKAPNGQTFVVRPGTIVGKNEGEVVEITMKGIRVVEKYVDFMNRETRKETFLKSHPAAVR